MSDGYEKQTKAAYFNDFWMKYGMKINTDNLIYFTLLIKGKQKDMQTRSLLYVWWMGSEVDTNIVSEEVSYIEIPRI